MAIEPGTKINQLLQTVPKGSVALSTWLKSELAIDDQLAQSYVRHGWLKRLARGVYCRPGSKVEWHAGLYALQSQARLPIHAGGKTALELQGYAHFLQLGPGSTVTFFAPTAVKLPLWFEKHDWKRRLRFTATNLFQSAAQLGLTHRDMGDYTIRLSAPERAMMEHLHFVPGEESFEESRLLMEGLTTLRPHVVQALLEVCSSVKVKRLFLYLAEACNHSWVGKLDAAKFDLGKGKRVIVKGGRLDRKYWITVPVK